MRRIRRPADFRARKPGRAGSVRHRHGRRFELDRRRPRPERNGVPGACGRAIRSDGADVAGRQRSADQGRLSQADHRFRPRAGRPEGPPRLLRPRLLHRRATGVSRELRRARPLHQPRRLRLRRGPVAAGRLRSPAGLPGGQPGEPHVRTPHASRRDDDARAEHGGRVRLREEVPPAVRQEGVGRVRPQGGPVRLRHLGRPLRRDRPDDAGDDRLRPDGFAADGARLAAMGLRLPPAGHLSAACLRSGPSRTCRQIAEVCAAHDIPWGLHDNYIDFYPDAEGYSYDHICFTEAGQPIRAWLNEGREAQSYRWRPDRFMPWLQRNLELIKPNLKPTHYFIDVFTSIDCFDYYDRAGDYHSMLETRKCWGEAFAWIRDYLGGNAPMTSEAGRRPADRLPGRRRLPAPPALAREQVVLQHGWPAGTGSACRGTMRSCTTSSACTASATPAATRAAEAGRPMASRATTTSAPRSWRATP